MFHYRFRHPFDSRWRYEVATSPEQFRYMERVMRSHGYAFEALQVTRSGGANTLTAATMLT